MYAWLDAALADDKSTVITANRRLARELQSVFAERRLETGVNAWRRPAIMSWNEWLAVLVEFGRPDASIPVRINAEQSRVVWEQCLRTDIDDPMINIGNLARLCRDSWKQLHEWRVPLAECQGKASGQDQRIFARAAGRYESRLRSEGWIDDATLPDELVRQFEYGSLPATGALTLAGFDRLTPQASALIDAAVDAGATQKVVAAEEPGCTRLVGSDTPDCELREAGRWARDVLAEAPETRIAIVVNDLQKDAGRSTRLLREGFIPGWQYSSPRYADAMNVSFGRRLGEYPAIDNALLMLRFLTSDLGGPDISLLLRSPFFGADTNFGRSRLELQLRDVPDRRWSTSLLLQFLHNRAGSDAADWLQRLAGAAERLQTLPARQTASRWAGIIDELLQALSWPGETALDSEDFQLINRWRDLLNEFARLDLVNGPISFDEAVARLGSLASETLFQAESSGTVVNVLGALEAAGMEFDKLWVAGLNASAWPPAGKPLVLVSRELQQQYSMPDSSPDDSTSFAKRVLDRLASSARDVVFSFPRLVGDAEQMPTALLAEIEAGTTPTDGGWHAATLLGTGLSQVADPVPPVRHRETVAGGAATINRQRTDPFAAFAHGRLGIRWMSPFIGGIPARIRGSLIHDALQQLYDDLPTHDAILQWTANEIAQRIANAVERPIMRHARCADSVLKKLLDIERERCAALLGTVVAVDRQRDSFRIVSVESDESVTLGGATFKLRCDRIDRDGDDALIVIDYKTGSKHRFLSGGEPADLQLVLYACALDAAISGLALFNVDTRATVLDGAGPAFDAGNDWPQRLADWKDIVRSNAAMIAAGDVRLNIQQSSRDARPLDVLSRYAELRRES